MSPSSHYSIFMAALAAALILPACSPDATSSQAAGAAKAAATSASVPGARISPAFPLVAFVGTPIPEMPLPNLETTVRPVKSVDLPVGVGLISQGKTVTTNSTEPITGSLDLITDGEMDAFDGYVVELDPGKVWIQIDLGSPVEIHGLWVWHNHKAAYIYKSVVATASNSAEGKEPTMIFNNDLENAHGFGSGSGSDSAYKESNYGRWMPVKNGPVKARYIRLYTDGRYLDEINHYIEVQVYGRALPKP